jgi:hypothetical protein
VPAAPDAAVTEHVASYGVGVTPDTTFIVPTCACGWRGPATFNIRAAALLWASHIEVGPEPATATPATHDTLVGPQGFGGGYFARCKTCTWSWTGRDHSEATARATAHRAESAAVEHEPAWYDLTADSFDADVDERRVLAEHWPA